MVKKINADGSACKKCDEVDAKMRAAGHFKLIDRVVYAEEQNPSSEGMIFSAMYGVEHAPFFIVEHDGGEPVIYTVYLEFVKKVLNASMSEGKD